MLLVLPPLFLDQIFPYVDLRDRFERRVNRDFSSKTGDDRSDILSRWRVGAEVKLKSGWSGEIRYQFSNDQLYTPGPDSATTNSDLDIADVSHAVGNGTATVGRQKINIGTQRLIGQADWLNVPRSFDGLRYKDGRWDVFAADISVISPRPSLAKIAGATFASGSGLTQLFFKHDRQASGEIDNGTLDEIYTLTQDKVTYDFEGALQAGHTAGKRLEAWAAHGRATYALTPRTSLYVEGNAASGGNGPKVVSTFDNLYPSNYAPYGIMDLQAWRNMTELVFGVDQRLAKDLLGKVSFHQVGLLNPSDGWYGATGAVNARPGGTYIDPTGRSGKDVGQEIDFEAVWSPKKTWSISAGIGMFLPGEFINHVSAGGVSDQTWAYLQFQTRF